MRMGKGNISASLEFEELSVAQKFGIDPLNWDELPVSERARLIAFSRDQAALEHIANLPKEERDSLRATAEWTFYDEEA
jgi:hypothetical protein